jgi:hypothetical protein
VPKRIAMKYTDYLLHILLGLLSGGVAAFTAVLMFRGLHAISYALANQLDGWLAVGTFVVFLLLTTILSGLAGGVAGGLAGGLVVRRVWHPTRRWLIAWLLVWAIAGVVLWVSYIQSRQGDFGFGLEVGGWWVVLGFVLAAASGVIAPPWRSAAGRHGAGADAEAAR